MSGIIGYLGGRPALPVLLQGLHRMEFKGYDSAGLAIIENGTLQLQKGVGKLAQLESRLNGFAPTGTLGLGHTRWATHGRPSDRNAQPHLDCTGGLAVVQNGIIENYRSLRAWLAARGHLFRSETDAEILAHLVEEYYAGDLVSAIQQVQEKIEGFFAAAVISIDQPDLMVAFRKESLLIAGLGDGENFVASDLAAVIDHTRRTYILENGEIAVLNKEKVEILDQRGRAVDKKIFMVEWEIKQAEKEGYPHFMLKEIHEQPQALRDTLSGRINSHGIQLDELAIPVEELRRISKIFITACGTAYHAGLVGKYLIENLARIPVEVDIASEFRYRNPILDQNSLAIVISQSGETADTLAALREVKRHGVPVLAVTNVLDSTVARESDYVLYTKAGPEIAIASTKAYISQLATMYLIALHLAQARHTLAGEKMQQVLGELAQLPDKVEQILGNGKDIEALARQYCQCESAFFIGRGLDYAVALEGSLKLKETSYIHAEAYPAGELKHGSIALVVEGITVVALATQPLLFEKTASSIKEITARDARVIAIALEGMEEVAHTAHEVIYIPSTHQALAPILAVVPLQLLAYHMAVARGCDVDQPRNLVKSVTVE